jgi:hypothetical protein
MAPARTGARFTSFALLTAQLTLIVAYLALVVAPFLVHGLHNQPEEQVAGGWFDPKSLWPEPIAPVMSTVATLAWGFAAYLSLLVLLASLATLATQWRRLLPASYMRLATTVALGAALFSFQWFTNTGALLNAWMAD